MAIIEVTKENLEHELIKNKKPIILDFWTEGCVPCKMQSTVFEQAEVQYGEQVIFGKVNANEQPELAQKYGIQGVPAMIILENGQVFKKEVGYRSLEDIGKLVAVSLASSSNLES